MKLSDIDTLTIDDDMPTEKKQLRKAGPKLLASVLNDSRAVSHVRSLESLKPEHIKALSGGKDALAYLINTPDVRVIIKLGTEGILAEAETVEAWKRRHVRVPAVLATGIVPATKGTKQALRFLVQEAMLDTNDRLVETCADFLIHSPRSARKIGQQLGRELQKIHSCVSDRQFGEFKDSNGSSSSYASWNGYIVDSITNQASYLRSLGIEQLQIDAVVAAVKRLSFVKQGRYLHGDFSIRNVAVRSVEPMKLSIFDPNPIIGDPTWDISFLKNNLEYKRRRLLHEDTERDTYAVYRQLWTGFKQTYVRSVPKKNLLSAQLIQAIYQAQYTESTGDKVGFRVRKELILELVERLSL